LNGHSITYSGSGKLFNVENNGELNISGGNGSIILTDSRATAIYYSTGQSSSVSGCTISGGAYGIKTSKGMVTLSNCTISGCGYGIYIERNDMIIGDGVTIKRCANSGIWFYFSNVGLLVLKALPIFGSGDDANSSDIWLDVKYQGKIHFHKFP
jgi:hypothetical protein